MGSRIGQGGNYKLILQAQSVIRATNRGEVGMNISTGGPQILFFERDQQMTALLTSEFQLAGYECYAARTAVEVFDVIARNSIQLVLINLAQAATSRHEFWVALEAQRRGRGIQVISFRCFNLASYGPFDPEERPSEVTADAEVDGMQGVMRLIELVRTRVPTANAPASTSQRSSKATVPIPAMPSPSPLMTANDAPWTSSLTTVPLPPRSGMIYQPELPPDGPPLSEKQESLYAPFTQNVGSPPMPPPTISTKTGAAASIVMPPSGTGKGAAVTGKPSYVEKIRAVLYPNQRTWSSQGKLSSSTMPDTNNKRDTQYSAPQAAPTNPAAEAPTLQHLANGQMESSLAQLSRMVQERQPFTREYTNHGTPFHPPESTQFGQQLGSQASYRGNGHVPYNADRMNYAPPAPTPRPTQYAENLSSIPLRASPIQDLPAERTGEQVNTDGLRRPDVLSRTNYGQQSTPTPPLSSIATSKPASNSSPYQAVPAPTVKRPALTPIPPHAEEKEKVTDVLTHQKIEERKKINKPVLVEQKSESAQERPPQNVPAETDEAKNNSLLMDIMQSLPPMPPPSAQPPQAIQPQVLNGRATRSLGSVLIEGHLVPQSRLEVAENIQRMLCGVDLNYQLGEILLMFKLLTPDQLLAASLVSFGLINTKQIGSLGRIRQELHAMGLEYDLENLLVLFRILTPEQVREVKASWQS